MEKTLKSGRILFASEDGACKRWMPNRGHLRFFRLSTRWESTLCINGVIYYNPFFKGLINKCVYLGCFLTPIPGVSARDFPPLQG